MERLLNKPYVNEVILRGQNLSLKCYQTLDFFKDIERGFRSFHIENIGSVGQSAPKLLSDKL